MLFVLDESLCQELGEDIPNQKLIDVLEDLATYRRAGRNLIFATRPVFSTIIKCSQLSERTTAVYKRLKDRSAEMGTVRSIFSTRIEITNGHGVELISPNDPKGFKVPYHELMLDNFSEPILLAENLNDADFYEIIAKEWLSLIGSSNFRLDFYSIGGGGSTISRQYKSTQDQQRRLCLCIVDSDQKTPSSRLGGTAKHVEDVDEPTRFLTKYFIIPARDAENLLPINLLESVLDAKENPKRKEAPNGLSRNKVSILEKIQTHSPEARFYLDMKKGLKVKDLRAERELNSYWESILNGMGLSTECECTHEPSECSCVIIDGLDDSMLHDCLVSLKNDSRQLEKIQESLASNPLLAQKWKSIGELVAAWCVAGSQFR